MHVPDRDHQIAPEAALDGLYIFRTGSRVAMDATESVRAYKSLAQVERAFRSLKTIDLKVRPIHHRLASRVRAHIFLCMLAYYVEWHMREAWRPDLRRRRSSRQGHPRPRRTRQALKAALDKAHTHITEDGTPAHSLAPLWPNSPPSCAIPAAHPRPRPCAHLRCPHHAEHSAAPRLQTDRKNHRVVRTKALEIHACICHTWNLSHVAGRNFRLADFAAFE